MRSKKFTIALVALVTVIAARSGWSETQVASGTRASVFSLKDDQSFNLKGETKKPDVGDPAKKKSMWKAAGLSFVLPGAGQYYLGRKSKAKVFLGIDVAAWAGFVGYKVYSHWKKDDLINYASTHASAQLAGKSDEYLDLVGFYSSTRQYNAEGRVGDRERPYYDESSEYYWQWASDSERTVYRSLKNASREANRRAQFMIGLAVVNRIISTIDAIRDARRQERSLDAALEPSKPKKVQLAIDPYDSHTQIRLTLFTGW